MKSQEHNKGELAKLEVMVEKKIVDTITEMAKHTGLPLEELVVIALKRFCSSHNDYLGRTPKVD